MEKSPAFKAAEATRVIAPELERYLTNLTGKKVRFSLFMWVDDYVSTVSNADIPALVPVLEGILEKWKRGDFGMPHELFDGKAKRTGAPEGTPAKKNG